MKLKEKLADDSYNAWFESDDCGVEYDELISHKYGTIEKAMFIAGFEKALQLAADYASDFGEGAGNEIMDLGDKEVDSEESVDMAYRNISICNPKITTHLPTMNLIQGKLGDMIQLTSCDWIAFDGSVWRRVTDNEQLEYTK